VISENRAYLSRMTWTNVLNHEALDRGVDVPRRNVLGSPGKWYDNNVLEASRAFSMLQSGYSLTDGYLQRLVPCNKHGSRQRDAFSRPAG
jgi:hypothetical protein